jgi:hypothetical protein
VEDLEIRLGRILDFLRAEDAAAQKWSKELNEISQEISQDLIKEESERFTEKSREYLHREIRALFAKYDVLARPRRFVKNILLTPFRFVGLRRKSGYKSQKDALLKIRQKTDLTPLQTAIEKFNRLVLERLSPSYEDSPLFKHLRQPDMVVKPEEIRGLIWEEQDRLSAWLEQTFKSLSKGIPRGKKWGIYSTSILWGILIISFETALGGGFTIIDAALDSAIAPFITKGAVELFAFHEIQKVARELARRYQEGLIGVVDLQRERYEKCLKALMANRETVESIQALHVAMATWKSRVAE